MLICRAKWDSLTKERGGVRICLTWVLKGRALLALEPDLPRPLPTQAEEVS